MSEDEGRDEEQESEIESGSTGDPDLDRQVADLEKARDKVGERIEETRADWESKKDDPAVPGAMADPDEDAPKGG